MERAFLAREAARTLAARPTKTCHNYHYKSVIYGKLLNNEMAASTTVNPTMLASIKRRKGSHPRKQLVPSRCAKAPSSVGPILGGSRATDLPGHSPTQTTTGPATRTPFAIASNGGEDGIRTHDTALDRITV